MKRLLTLLIALMLTLSLSAVPFTYDVSVGHRNSSILTSPVFVGAKFGIENFSAYVQTDLGEQFDFVFQYDIKQGRTITHTVDSFVQLVPSEGGVYAISYAFKQQFDLSWFYIRYGIGVQLGLNWSNYIVPLGWSVSPIGELTLGINTHGFDFSIYATAYLAEERSWKSTLVTGSQISYEFNDVVKIYAMAYAEIAELFMQPYIVIASYGGKVGVSLRGTI